MANSLTSTALTLGSGSVTSIVNWGGSTILGGGYNFILNNTSTYTATITDSDGRIPNMSVGQLFSGYYHLHATAGYYAHNATLSLPTTGSYEVARADHYNPAGITVLETIQHGPVLMPFRSGSAGTVLYYTEKLAGSTVIGKTVSTTESDNDTYVRVVILRVS